MSIPMTPMTPKTPMSKNNAVDISRSTLHNTSLFGKGDDYSLGGSLGTVSTSSGSTVTQIDDAAYFSLFKKAQMVVPGSSKAAPPIKAVSKLDSFTIKWINKRKCNITDRVTSHILPSKTKEIRRLFDGFDVDKTGEIKIPVLQQSVQYIATLTKIDPMLKDQKVVDEFFYKMDADGNGNIDFGEFLAVMGSEQGHSDFAIFCEKLNQAFFDYGVHIKRNIAIDYARKKKEQQIAKAQSILQQQRKETLSPGSAHSKSAHGHNKNGVTSPPCPEKFAREKDTDLEELRGFGKLFKIKYFTKDFAIVDSEENIKKNFEKAHKEMFNYNERRTRRTEVVRSKIAAKKTSSAKEKIEGDKKKMDDSDLYSEAPTFLPVIKQTKYFKDDFSISSGSGVRLMQSKGLGIGRGSREGLHMDWDGYSSIERAPSWGRSSPLPQHNEDGSNLFIEENSPTHYGAYGGSSKGYGSTGSRCSRGSKDYGGGHTPGSLVYNANSIYGDGSITGVADECSSIGGQSQYRDGGTGGSIDGDSTFTASIGGDSAGNVRRSLSNRSLNSNLQGSADNGKYTRTIPRRRRRMCPKRDWLLEEQSIQEVKSYHLRKEQEKLQSLSNKASTKRVMSDGINTITKTYNSLPYLTEGFSVEQAVTDSSLWNASLGSSLDSCETIGTVSSEKGATKSRPVQLLQPGDSMQ